MRKLLLLAVTASFFFLSAMPAQATHGTVDFFDGSKQGDHWNPAQTETICMSQDFNQHLGLQQELKAREAMQTALSRWESDTQLPASIFSFASSLCGDINIPQEWANSSGLADFCNGVPLSRPSSIQMDDNVSGGFTADAVGTTLTCDRNDNGYIDYFVIWVKKDIQDVNNFHYDFTANVFPNPGNFDFGGLIVHELGHAIGWDYNGGHLFGHCAHDGSWHTMCAGDFGFYRPTGGTGTANGAQSRSLETYDISETNDAY